MRIDNWPRYLNEYINSVKDNKWQYGTFDCCTFTAGAVEAITGVDYMEEFRGKYDDVDSSIKALENIGAGDLYKTLRRKFGKPVHGAAGKKGDIIFFDGCCGICIGTQGMIIGSMGLALVPMVAVKTVFQVT